MRTDFYIAMLDVRILRVRLKTTLGRM